MKEKLNLRFFATLLLGIFATVTVWAQDINVTGTVIDAFGDPVMGASVIQVGTTNGCVTDLDGNFALKAPKGATIRISFIGYVAQELPAAEKMNVTLNEDSELLEDVVVIGYGVAKKNDLTGSVTAIKANEMNRGAITSPEQFLQGKVPGLLVTPASGDPTGGATIRVRGAASLYASNDPLIVIDGVPVTAEGGAGMANPLATVNPNDIESFTVLKDASATAIYGSRASNGVIMITTKKGTSDKVKLSYSSSYSIKQNTSTLDVMDANQYRDYVNTVIGSESNRGKAILSMMGNANTDWQKEIYRTAFSTDQNISAYGKTLGVPFRASVGYNYNQATLKVGGNQRVNASISLTPTFLHEHLSVNLNAKGIYNKAEYPNGGAVGSALAFNPTLPIYFTKADGSIDYDNCNGYTNWLASDGSANAMASTNPLSNLYDSHNQNDTYRSLGNLQLDYKIHGFEDLRLNLNLGYDFSRTTGENYNKLGSITSKLNGPEDGYYDYSNQNSNTLLEFYANYNKEINKHHVDLMAGYSWQHNYVKYSTEESRRNAQNDWVLYNVPPIDRREYYLVSFFGRLNYSYDSRYLFTFSLRDDASSRFSKDNRWGLFPSAALAWRVKGEDFLKDVDDISEMKLRFGWGRTGQQDIGMDRCYAYQAKYTTSSALTMRIPWGGDWIYTLAPNAYNPNIKWETTETFNVGVDFGIFNGRVNGNIDAYLRKTYDLLNDVITPMGNNFSNTVISNVGDMENKGLEFNVNVIPIQNSDMRWTINFNGTFQSTKITKLTNNDEGYLGVQTGANMGGTGGFTSLYRVGYTPNTYYLYQQAYDEEGNAIENVLVDRNGDGIINQEDRYITGKSAQPKFFYGLSSQFNYKNWDLGFNAHGSVGGYGLNKTFMNNASSYSDDWSKGYIDNYSTTVLKTGWTAPISDLQKYSDISLENISFFRMDDINVGYTFDKIKNWKGTIRVGASVQNVFTITNYSGLDPELTSGDGVDNNLIPRPRQYTLRLSINF